MADELAAAVAQPIFELDDITVRYMLRKGAFARGTTELLAVDGVSLSVFPGETLGLVGQTGSGKSTIAQVITGMVVPTSGAVRIAGHQLHAHADRPDLKNIVQVVLQDPYSSLNPRIRVWEIIAEPLTRARRIRGAKRAEIRERVETLLGQVGLSPTKANAYPHELSGGQRQRVSIARALAPSPSLIVLDEPTSALDVSMQAQILTLLRRIQDELGVAYLVISHDLVTVGYLSPTIATMYQGRIVEIGPTTSILESPHHPYTVELMASTASIGGSLINMPSATRSDKPLPAAACRFASRCLLRERLGSPAACLESDPKLLSVATSHQAACHFSDKTPALAEEVDAAVRQDPGRT
jgi:oligopeptide/dipeptide ABC transporter ATP-binding protein